MALSTIPLAERMRPYKLSNYIGQEHLAGPGAILRKSIESNTIPSIIFWGPPGVGKTTLAGIIASELRRPFYILSAISSGVKDVREVIEKAQRYAGELFAMNYAAFGLVMILFLVFEPLGLVGIWHRVQSYFLLWPFKHRPIAGSRK